MRGPCLCGDPCCPSCGPAQGNFRCEVCGRWSEDGGCEDPERCARESKEMDEQFAKDLEESGRLAKEWEAQR